MPSASSSILTARKCRPRRFANPSNDTYSAPNRFDLVGGHDDRGAAARTPWSEDEISAVVESHFRMFGVG
jgi:hypothetical protein